MSMAKDYHKDMIKRYRGELWSKFIRAIKQYSLIENGDKIAVALSGGKDSFLLAKMLSELRRHPLVDFDIVVVAMDPGYDPKDVERIRETAKSLGLNIVVEKKDIFKVVGKKAPDNPCYLCARMRRGSLYALAEKHGCNKLALGHHFDDVVETTLLNMFFSGTFKTMLPKVSSDNFEGIELIRPLYFIKEQAVKKITSRNNIDTMDCGCTVASGERPSKRQEIKELLASLKKVHKDVEKCIFRSASNVNLDYVLAWEKDGEKHRFDDE